MGTPGTRTAVAKTITFEPYVLQQLDRRSDGTPPDPRAMGRLQALLGLIDRHGWRIAVPAVGLSQAWHGEPSQPRFTALLRDYRTEVVPFDDLGARLAGIAYYSWTRGPLEASLALCARERGYRIVTNSSWQGKDVATLDYDLRVYVLYEHDGQ